MIRRFATLALAAMVLLAAAPYRDTRGRFSIAQPPGWQLAPDFGDTRGTTFRRDLSGESRPLLFTIHAHPSDSSSLESFANAVEVGAPLPRSFSTERRLGAHRTLIRHYGNEQSATRSYFISGGAYRYHLRVEGTERAVRRAAVEIETMVASLAAPKENERLPKHAVPSLAGRWAGEGGVLLSLGADGAFILGPKSGRYRVTDHRLELQVRGRPTLSFDFVLDPGAQTLTLTSASLSAPAVYRRAPEAKAMAPAGRWRTGAGEQGIELTLASDGAFSFGTMSGRWAAKGERLELSAGEGETIGYRFSVDGDRLQLSGGDLEAPLVFDRIRGP